MFPTVENCFLNSFDSLSLTLFFIFHKTLVFYTYEIIVMVDLHLHFVLYLSIGLFPLMINIFFFFF